MTDPFLPEQGVPRNGGDGAVQPEDHDLAGESEPDVLPEPAGHNDPATEEGEPPTLPSVFHTPTGESIDPSQLS